MLRTAFRGRRLRQHQADNAAVLTGFQNAFGGLGNGQRQYRRTVFNAPREQFGTGVFNICGREVLSPSFTVIGMVSAPSAFASFAALTRRTFTLLVAELDHTLVFRR